MPLNKETKPICIHDWNLFFQYPLFIKFGLFLTYTENYFGSQISEGFTDCFHNTESQFVLYLLNTGEDWVFKQCLRAQKQWDAKKSLQMNLWVIAKMV